MTREFPDRPIAGVGVVVLGAKGVLLVKRAKPPRQGQWSLPGGAQKLGETVFEAARRETLEETGLEIEVLGLIDVVDSIASGDGDGDTIRYHYTLVDCAAVWTGGEVRAGSDAAHAQWWPLARLNELPLWSETVRIIAEAVALREGR